MASTDGDPPLTCEGLSVSNDVVPFSSEFATTDTEAVDSNVGAGVKKLVDEGPPTDKGTPLRFDWLSTAVVETSSVEVTWPELSRNVASTVDSSDVEIGPVSTEIGGPFTSDGLESVLSVIVSGVGLSSGVMATVVSSDETGDDADSVCRESGGPFTCD